MPYPELMVKPMREDLTRLGVEELTDAEKVDRFMADDSGSAMLVVNSVCGCAAGMARPAVALALQHENKPDRVATVFAGQDVEATERARSYFADVPPTSPSIMIIKGGQLVDYVPRHRIENRDAHDIANDLTEVFDKIA
jgi:putative YphP/YqiW family bacilliredoxin